MSDGNQNWIDLYRRLMDLHPPAIRGDTSHYEAVGRLVTAYANAEAAVHIMARRFSGLSDEKARAVFAGMRLSEVIGSLRACMEVDGVSPKTIKEVEDCLTQLKKVGDRRHRLVHRSSIFAFGELSVTNVHTAKSTKHREFEKFSVQEMADIAWDCSAIFVRLLKLALPEAMSTEIAKSYRGPWRYKPVKKKMR